MFVFASRFGSSFLSACRFGSAGLIGLAGLNAGFAERVSFVDGGTQFVRGLRVHSKNELEIDQVRFS